MSARYHFTRSDWLLLSLYVLSVVLLGVRR